jgi:hypothetical protein
MGSPHRPKFVKQLDGSKYAGLNCTCAAAAMAIDRATLGLKQYSGATIRLWTGDTVGGTNLAQMVTVAAKVGVTLTDIRGALWTTIDTYLHDGRGAILQGSSSVTRGTKYSASETFGGNHAWWVNEGRGWTMVNGFWRAAEYLVYDPLADGRRTGIASSPMWIPAYLVQRFAAELQITSYDGTFRKAGDRAWVAFTPDTEPHVHLRSGATRTSPFPDRTRAYNTNPAKRVNVRGGPSTSAAIVETLAVGDLFIASQKVAGQLLAGSTTWYGDHDGKRWVHVSGLRYTGGTT